MDTGRADSGLFILNEPDTSLALFKNHLPLRLLLRTLRITLMPNLSPLAAYSIDRT